MKNNFARRIAATVLLVATMILVATAFGCKEKENENMNKNPVATFVIKAQSGESLTVRIELYPDKAPITVANFTELANSGFYDGLTFHRVVPGGCIQGGGYRITETDQGLSLDYPEGVPEPIKGEFASNGWDSNDIAHEAGVISMARTSDPDSATSQFFICVGSYPSWDGEYAAFGKATDEESLKNIAALGRSTYVNAGSGFTTFPYPLVSIISVRVA